MAISLLFPLEFGANGYKSFSDSETKAAIKQHFKMLLLTSPGEYVMDLNFGVGLYNYLFELQDQERLRSIKPSILNQVSLYMPYVNILQIDLDFNGAERNAMRIKIRYRTSESELDGLFNLPVST